MTLKKLEKQELLAERGALVSLIDEAVQSMDVVGADQFRRKLAKVNESLAQLELIPANRAAVALFFGGAKVIGSHGIEADFAGEVLEDFQDLISKSFARRELGALGARGPVPIRANSNLMVTNVTRGSFGFVLEEIGDQQEAFNTQLSEAVDAVASLVADISAPQEDDFIEAVGEMDSRMVSSTRNFFLTLSKAQATMRLVEGDREILLDRDAVERGRERTESLEVSEEEGLILEGVLLGILPRHRRFEFVVAGREDAISGKVSAEIGRETGDQLLGGQFNPVGKTWRAEFALRTVTRPGQPVRTYYTLTRLLQELPNNRDVNRLPHDGQD